MDKPIDDEANYHRIGRLVTANICADISIRIYNDPSLNYNLYGTYYGLNRSYFSKNGSKIKHMQF